MRHQNGTWETVATQGSCTARHEAAMVAVKGRLYLLGGRGIKPVDEFDPKTSTWRPLARPPLELHHFQAVALKDRIAIVGAMTGGYPHETPIPNVWFFDPAKNAWSKGPEIPEARRRGGAGVVVVGEKVYVIGGITDGHWSGFRAWLDVWDTRTGKWEVLPDAPRPRDHFQAGLLNGKLIAVGGRTSYGEKKQVFDLTIPEVDAFDLKKRTWETLAAPLPTPRAGSMTIVRGDTLLMIGGESTTQDLAHSQVEALTRMRGSWIWKAFPALKQGRHGSGLGFVGDTLYIAAGSGKRGGSPELNTLEKFVWS